MHVYFIKYNGLSYGKYLKSSDRYSVLLMVCVGGMVASPRPEEDVQCPDLALSTLHP